jgi:hypothetical protein
VSKRDKAFVAAKGENDVSNMCSDSGHDCREHRRKYRNHGRTCRRGAEENSNREERK